MSHLRFNRDNSVLACPCGAHSYTTLEWQKMTEHQWIDAKLKAAKCQTCKTIEEGEVA